MIEVFPYNKYHRLDLEQRTQQINNLRRSKIALQTGTPLVATIKKPDVEGIDAKTLD